MKASFLFHSGRDLGQCVGDMIGLFDGGVLDKFDFGAAIACDRDPTRIDRRHDAIFVPQHHARGFVNVIAIPLRGVVGEGDGALQHRAVFAVEVVVCVGKTTCRSWRSIV